MFSQLGPLFKTTFRQAESNDTRQAIPHNERDNGQSKKDERHKQEAPSDFWEDSTSVSVGALKTFLVNFLQTMPETGDTMPVIPDSADPQTIAATTADGPNARAAAAYQSTAQKSPTQTPPTPAADNKKFDPTADKLQSRELRDVHALIRDLDFLAEKGVQELYILRADSFLESLKNAAALAKSNTPKL